MPTDIPDTNRTSFAPRARNVQILLAIACGLLALVWPIVMFFALFVAPNLDGPIDGWTRWAFRIAWFGFPIVTAICIIIGIGLVRGGLRAMREASGDQSTAGVQRASGDEPRGAESAAGSGEHGKETRFASAPRAGERWRRTSTIRVFLVGFAVLVMVWPIALLVAFLGATWPADGSEGAFARAAPAIVVGGAVVAVPICAVHAFGLLRAAATRGPAVVPEGRMAPQGMR